MALREAESVTMPNQSERDERVIELVLAALEQPPEGREKYLRSTCGNDFDLLREVDERVQWEVRMGGFLCEPFIETLAKLDRPFKPGALVAGRFRILSEIGHGGMGVVYEAWDEMLDRRVALKTAMYGHDKELPPEVRAAREVSHFNVCKVHELHSTTTEIGQIQFLTMEFIAGETLSARIRRAGPLPLTDAQEIATQICAGLAQAHRQGVVHGDLKCSNVILAERPEGGIRAVITDFGLALLGFEEARGGISPLRGSFDYMAPELFLGIRASVASDLYALGVIFHEMLTGAVPVPFSSPPLSADASTLTLDRSAHGVIAKRQCENLPQPWGAIVSRCLESAPENRFGTADEITAQLEGKRRKAKWLWMLLPAAASIVAAVLWLEQGISGPTVRLAILPIAV